MRMEIDSHRLFEPFQAVSFFLIHITGIEKQILNDYSLLTIYISVDMRLQETLILGNS